MLTNLFFSSATKICLAQREYDTVRIGMPPNKVSYYVEINYYPDKELLVKTQTGCLRACSMENEFICRSILYRANYKPGQPSKLTDRSRSTNNLLVLPCLTDLSPSKQTVLSTISITSRCPTAWIRLRSSTMHRCRCSTQETARTPPTWKQFVQVIT